MFGATILKLIYAFLQVNILEDNYTMNVKIPEKIKEFLSRIETVVTEGLVTLEKAEVHIYRGSNQDK